MTTLHDIGSQLREERQRRKLFKVKLAQASGVHRNTVSDLEAGVGNVELNTLLALCEQLGLDVHLVAKDSGSPAVTTVAVEQAPKPLRRHRRTKTGGGPA
jgi:transcriptional regulator with XRE-family HTH domain